MFQSYAEQMKILMKIRKDNEKFHFTLTTPQIDVGNENSLKTERENSQENTQKRITMMIHLIFQVKTNLTFF